MHFNGMYGLITISFVFMALSGANGFMNPYPRFRKYNDGGNPGTPLYLTPLIRNESMPRDQIQEQARVHLGPLKNNHTVTSYSGLLTVDENYNSSMFFWYFPSEEDPSYAPVVLWLQGGPGASSLFGLFTENGPFVLNKKEKVHLRDITWSQSHNLIYIDNPVGTGFSQTGSDKGYAKDENDVGKNLHEAMQQLYELFEWSDLNGFWLSGESYAGKYIPALAHQIHTSQNPRVHIPLRGMAIGNGFSDPIHQLKYGDYLYQLGLIDENGLKQFQDAEKIIVVCISKHELDCAAQKFDELMNGNGSLFYNLTGLSSFYNYLQVNGSFDNSLGDFLQSSNTRRAIHVGNLPFHDSDDENKVEKFLRRDIMDSVAPWIEDLLKAYHVCIYNGQLDIIVAYPLTVNYLSHLHFRDASYYKVASREIWRVDDEIAGYTKTAGNLIEVMVRKAGHMVPVNQPKWMYNLIYQLTHFKSVV